MTETPEAADRINLLEGLDGFGAAFEPQANPLDEILMMTTGIVVAFVGSSRQLPDGGLPALIASTYAALADLDGTANVADATAARQTKTEAEVTASITPDHLISFIDGGSYKTLRRHLTLHGHTAESYRETFGLPADYPMTSANYSAARSELAKAAGLGSHRARAVEAKAAA